MMDSIADLVKNLTGSKQQMPQANSNPMDPTKAMQAAIDMAQHNNPIPEIQNLASSNPNYASAMAILSACNGNYEAAVKQLANLAGKNVNDWINLYNQMNGH